MDDEAICEVCHWKGCAEVSPWSKCPHCEEEGTLMLQGVWKTLEVDDHPDSTVIDVAKELNQDLPPNMLGDDDGCVTS